MTPTEIQEAITLGTALVNLASKLFTGQASAADVQAKLGIVDGNAYLIAHGAPPVPTGGLVLPPPTTTVTITTKP